VLGVLHRGHAKRESFDKSDAERPGIGNGRKGSGWGFGCIVGGGFLEGIAWLTEGRNAVARKFDLIAGGQNVRGLDVAVREALGMKKSKCPEDGFEHATRFRRREWALGKNLGKIFFLELHDHVEHVRVLEHAAPGLKERNQVGMGELSGAVPERKLAVGGGGVRWHELDGGFLRTFVSKLGGEDGGVVRSAQIFTEEKFRVDNLALPFFTGFDHGAPPMGEFRLANISEPRFRCWESPEKERRGA